MREAILCSLFLLWCARADAQNPPVPASPTAGWKTIKDGKGICQISVPPEWAPLDASTGAAIFQDTTTAIAVVTSQPDQKYQPLTETLQKLLGVRKEKLFENTAKRVFYQDKVSSGAEEPNAFGASMPGTNGTCSCRVTFLPVVTEETARKIALSLAPVPPQQ
jgi:hypothetical protein